MENIGVDKIMIKNLFTIALIIGAIAFSIAPATAAKATSGSSPKLSDTQKALLRAQLARIRRVVFTKHHNQAGSHYAYTEKLSDHMFVDRWRDAGFVPGGGLYLLEIGDDLKIKTTALLEDAGGVIRDPDVSWDGKRILFAWKKSHRKDDYHLYEMDVASRKIRQLTFGLGFADYEGVYLPGGEIMFSSTRCVQITDCWWTPVSNLFKMDKDGKFMRRVGFDQVSTNYPKVHPTLGYVTYTRWEYNDRGQIYPQPLFQMNPDATAQTEYYGNNSWFPTSILHARGIANTGKVVCILSGHHTHQRGKLAIIDPTRGRQEGAGVTQIAPVKTFKGKIKVDAWGQSGEQWQYPYPLDEKHFLAAHSPTGANNTTAGSKGFGIYLTDIQGEKVLLASDPKIPCGQPVPLKPRPKPQSIPTRTDFRKKTGVFTMEDIYIGPGLKGIKRGTIKKLRVVALRYRAFGLGSVRAGAVVSTPVGMPYTSWEAKVILGQADVYPDGSAAFEVPARTPVYFQAVDAKGLVVQTMRSWSTLQPGEVFSCIGCHEDKNLAVPTRKQSIAMKKGIQPLNPFHDISGVGFSYPKIIQPIWNKHCTACHGHKKTPAGGPRAGKLLLTGETTLDKGARKQWSESYRSLVGSQKKQGPNNRAAKHLTWISPQSAPPMLAPYTTGAAKSSLLKYLEKTHYKVSLSQAEKDKVSAWIDLVVPYSGDYTEGMSPQDAKTYNRGLAKRKRWQAQEAKNIKGYIEHQTKP